MFYMTNERLLYVGMAYANLAEVEAIYGIYTAIFPVIIYTLLGPSKHVSMGTYTQQKNMGISLSDDVISHS